MSAFMLAESNANENVTAFRTTSRSDHPRWRGHEMTTIGYDDSLRTTMRYQGAMDECRTVMQLKDERESEDRRKGLVK